MAEGRCHLVAPARPPCRASAWYCAFMQQDWAGHTIRTRTSTQISDEAGERGPKVKMHQMHLGRSVSEDAVQSMNETVHTARARRSIASHRIASSHCCCILQSVMPTFTEPKQQGADDMSCCIARLERVAVMSAANKFSLPRRPVPVGHGHEASCIGPPAAFFFFFAFIPSFFLPSAPNATSTHVRYPGC